MSSSIGCFTFVDGKMVAVPNTVTIGSEVIEIGSGTTTIKRGGVSVSCYVDPSIAERTSVKPEKDEPKSKEQSLAEMRTLQRKFPKGHPQYEYLEGIIRDMERIFK